MWVTEQHKEICSLSLFSVATNTVSVFDYSILPEPQAYRIWWWFCFCQFWICREKLLVVMVKAMKNPRSALCKTSIMTCSDIFGAFGEKLLQQPHLKSMDDLVK